MTLQPSLFEEEPGTSPVASPARVRVLAGIIAGFAWPGLGGNAKIPAEKQRLAEQVAADAIATLVKAAP